ncbi:MAG: hypothetical protein ABEK16_00115 [Candidatus Nanohalobium sp.]
MIDQIINAVQTQGSGISILLVVALILALVIAFKLMEMVFETVIVTLLSGAFYVTLKYMQGGPIDINDLLLFSFLGASLYMVYSLLASLYKVGSTVIPIPYHVAKTVAKPFEYIWEKIEERQKRKSYVDRDQVEKDKKDKGDKSTKEVILGNKDKDGEDSDED